MPPENGPMSMSSESNINQQADGQMMANPQQIAQQQMIMQTGEYGEVLKFSKTCVKIHEISTISKRFL